MITVIILMFYSLKMLCVLLLPIDLQGKSWISPRKLWTGFDEIFLVNNFFHKKLTTLNIITRRRLQNVIFIIAPSVIFIIARFPLLFVKQVTIVQRMSLKYLLREILILLLCN